MSLDVYLSATIKTEVFSANITHNLNKMAEEAGIYKHLWRPEELNITKAGELRLPLAIGLKKLLEDPKYFEMFNPENGWGNYDGLVIFVRKYLEACTIYPQADIHISR